ncbi:DUF5000 domain-containing lipoprotein [Mariniflexile litorale]|uniref:DUF5000 domain-containing lipoprotein n=1 Tax=Mariniflexile litorale TaxID=3045158 RepID=A0AAU7EER0_9FLAO|nr:DUF5000 domain-containing lipoprotein [Mariniflexile sp. KMM 9835]MDQ8211935.1 DUF5000 domain-containing lipoprotein [Mariniflexile sp. KMM 9835]
MKNRIILIIFGICISACSEEIAVGQPPLESIAPGLVTNLNAISVPGGAFITFTPPIDEDLLYTKAVYSRRKGEITEYRSSLYSDTLKIEGFGNTNDQVIKIIAVDRSRNESEPVSITITPLEPAVNVIAQTLDVKPDFGGITNTWTNEGNAEISLVLEEEDLLLGELAELETFYSKATNGKFSVYGLDTIPKTIQYHFEDRWQNRSEIQTFTITPFYETEYEKSRFAFIDLPGDGPHHGGWKGTNIWNDTNENPGYSSQGGQGIWPQSITIDLGTAGLISRMTVYQRVESDNYVYAEGNLKKFEVWGAETLDTSGNWDSWTKLGDFESIKPSGLPFGTFSDEDEFIAKNGENFSFPASNPKVRYLRILVTETWAGGDNFQIMELDIFGDNR